MKSSLKLVVIFELFEGVVIFELFEGVVIFELVFVFELVIIFELFNRPSTFRIDLVIVELAFVFELFEGLVVFELFDRPSTWSSLNSLSSSNSLKAWLSLNCSTGLRLGRH